MTNKLETSERTKDGKDRNGRTDILLLNRGIVTEVSRSRGPGSETQKIFKEVGSKGVL